MTSEVHSVSYGERNPLLVVSRYFTFRSKVVQLNIPPSSNSHHHHLGELLGHGCRLVDFSTSSSDPSPICLSFFIRSCAWSLSFLRAMVLDAEELMTMRKCGHVAA